MKLILLTLILALVHAINFEVLPDKPQCLIKGVERGQLLKGKYQFSEKPGLKNTIEIKTSDGHVYLRQSNTTGAPIALTPDTTENMEFCFKTEVTDNDLAVDLYQQVELSFNEQLATVEDSASSNELSTLERQVRAMSFYAKRIRDGYTRIRTNEEIQSKHAQSSSSQVLIFGALALVCYTILSFGQVWYLKKYFKKKKLI